MPRVLDCHLGAKSAICNGCAPCKGGVLQWVQIPPRPARDPCSQQHASIRRRQSRCTRASRVGIRNGRREEVVDGCLARKPKSCDRGSVCAPAAKRCRSSELKSSGTSQAAKRLPLSSLSWLARAQMRKIILRVLQDGDWQIART